MQAPAAPLSLTLSRSGMHSCVQLAAYIGWLQPLSGLTASSLALRSCIQVAVVLVNASLGELMAWMP